MDSDLGTSSKKSKSVMLDAFKRATSEMLMLCLLQERPMYAYEVIRELKKRSSSHYEIGTLYFVTSRLKKGGYIKEVEETTLTDKKRKYYSITDTGILYCKELRKQYDTLMDSVQMILDTIK